MARSPIEIALASETKAFRQGIESGVIQPLEDAVKQLRELGDTDGADKLEQQLREAQKATEKLADETKITAARIESEYRDAGRKAKASLDDVGDGGKKGFGRAGEASKEFKEESLANLSEVASSFNGSMESVGDLVQGTLGGVAANIPVIGVAAAGAAAGVGVITDAFVKAGEAADEARDSAFQFAYDVQGALDTAGYSQRIAEWTGDTEKLKQAQDIAKISGQNVADVIDALASGGEKLDGLWDAFEQGANTTDVATNRALELEGALKGTREGYLNGADAARIAAGLNYEYATSVGVATGETDELGNAIYKLPDGKEIVVNAKTKTAYEDLDALERRQISDKTAWVRLQVDDREVRYYEPPAKRGTVYFSGGNVAQII